MSAEVSCSTGLPRLDEVLCGIRAGDNIVWQVDDIEDHLPFVEAFVAHAREEIASRADAPAAE